MKATSGYKDNGMLKVKQVTTTLGRFRACSYERIQ
jgi:hypothetical protein